MKTFLLSLILAIIKFSTFAQTSYSLDPASKLCEFNLNGPVRKLIEYHFYDKDDDKDTIGRRWYNILEFDRAGNLLTERRYSVKRHLLVTFIFSYSKRDTVQITQIEQTGCNFRLQDLIYNSLQQLIESDQFGLSYPHITFKKLFTYDTKGNGTSSVLLFANGKIAERNTFIYNDRGQKSSEATQSFNHELDAKRRFSYDNDRHLISEKDVPGNGNTFSSELFIDAERKYNTFDKYGNWLVEEYIQHTPANGRTTLDSVLRKMNLHLGKDDTKDRPEVITRQISYYK